jgi:hypothetical protein
MEESHLPPSRSVDALEPAPAPAADSSVPRRRGAALPVILIAAVVQGWSLYGLDEALDAHAWPATDERWLIALYALAVFVPATVQLLADHARRAAPLIGMLAVAYLYFGWHAGADIVIAQRDRWRGPDEYLPLALLLTILWLMALPFAQSRLAGGGWRPRYPMLFANAWRNKLALAEAALFTGLLWLLLFLWQALFHMLGMDFFKELFEKPVFVYPVTSLAFGCALHLVGSIERLTAAVLEQLLNVLKWLALIAGPLLVFFTIALVFKLPTLVFTGQKSIGAAWLLWLVAVTVLLLNAAYRDGSMPAPYPRAFGLFLRFAIPLMVVISLTALYALIMRARHYGLSVERVWAFVVAAAALAYSIGYSAAALRKGAWLAGVAPVNIGVALALIAVITAALTPVLSPYRLAANSQYRRVLEQDSSGLEAGTDTRTFGPFGNKQGALEYLRFDAGRYGVRKLEELSKLEDGRYAAKIREQAKALLAQESRWGSRPKQDFAPLVAQLRIFPAGRTLEPELAAKLAADLNSLQSFVPGDPTTQSAGVFADLNGDHADEFVFLYPGHGLIYEKRYGQWQAVGQMHPLNGTPPNCDFNLLAELDAGRFSAVPEKWSYLEIGDETFRVTATEPPMGTSCPKTMQPQTQR